MNELLTYLIIVIYVGLKCYNEFKSANLDQDLFLTKEDLAKYIMYKWLETIAFGIILVYLVNSVTITISIQETGIIA